MMMLMASRTWNESTGTLRIVLVHVAITSGTSSDLRVGVSCSGGLGSRERGKGLTSIRVSLGRTCISNLKR